MLGSRSSETRLKAGVVLPCEPGDIPFRRLPHTEGKDRDEDVIRVIAGPDSLRLAGRDAIEGLGSFRVLPESNRVGLRLEGEPVQLSDDPNHGDENVMELFARAIPPDQQNWITKGATLVRFVCSFAKFDAV